MSLLHPIANAAFLVILAVCLGGVYVAFSVLYDFFKGDD